MFAGVSLKLTAIILCLLPQQTVSPLPAQKTVQVPQGRLSNTVGGITLPFEYYKQHIYISVTVNGQSGLAFMLDSGADKNVLGLRTARRLGMQIESLKQEPNLGFGDGRMYTAPEQRVDAQIVSIPAARVMSIIDLTKFERHFSHITDGMLGLPFFRRFVVKLDYQKKIMSLLPADRYTYRGPGVRVRLKTRRNFIVIPVMIRGASRLSHPAKVVVDTGSNATLMVYKSSTHNLQLESSMAHAQPGKAYGLNGYYPVARARIPWLRIGAAETENLPVDYIKASDGIFPIRDAAGLIGNGVLQGFQVVIFDLPHRQIIFEVKPPQFEPGLVRMTTRP